LNSHILFHLKQARSIRQQLFEDLLLPWSERRCDGDGQFTQPQHFRLSKQEHRHDALPPEVVVVRGELQAEDGRTHALSSLRELELSRLKLSLDLQQGLLDESFSSDHH
jgi:uncharacterized ferritin-like protein (DUF455 family)